MKETEATQEPAKQAETDPKAEAKKAKKEKQQSRGSLDRIRSAKTVEEIDAILNASVQFKLASEGTRKKWRKASDRRRKALAAQ